MEISYYTGKMERELNRAREYREIVKESEERGRADVAASYRGMAASAEEDAEMYRRFARNHGANV